MHHQPIISVSDESQVGEARRAAARLAREAGLSEVRQAELAIVTTELANNLRRYGQDGRILLRVLPTSADAPSPSVEVLAIDRGPGIDNVSRSLEDGYSTGGTPGTGLGAVRRLATEFDLHSAAGKGTVVLACVRAERAGEAHDVTARTTLPRFTWGAVATAAPHEPVCGDAWRVVETADGVVVLVVDGLGHGVPAADASNAAAALFTARAADTPSPRDLLELIHGHLAGTRGGAAAIASFACSSYGRCRLRYGGLGNISGSLVTPTGSRGLPSHNGTLGVLAKRFQEFDYDVNGSTLLVMHSDGVQTRWSLADHPGLVMRHPSIIAAVLHRDHLRGRDDATVVVVRVEAK